MANAVTLVGSAIVASNAPAASLCRVSGYLHDIHGNPLKGYKLTLRHIHSPMTVGNNVLVLNERQSVTASSTGLVQFDVYRKATVQIELQGRLLDLMRTCIIPDAASANIVDIVFPYISSVAFATGDASVGLSAGAEHSYTVTATLSNGETLDVSGQAVLASSNTSVATVESNKVLAVSSGSSNITITSITTSELALYQEPDGDVIARLSEPTITLPSAVTVTVS